MPTRSEIISECGQIQASRLRDFRILQHCDLISKLSLWFFSQAARASGKASREAFTNKSNLAQPMSEDSCHLSHRRYHSSYHSSYIIAPSLTKKESGTWSVKSSASQDGTRFWMFEMVCWHVCHVDSPHAALHSSMLGKMEATPSTRWRIPCGIRKRIHQKWSMVIEIWLKYWNYINYYWNMIANTVEILLKYLKDTWNILGLYFNY